MHNDIKLNINKKITSYFLGFLFSVILTLLSFLVVMKKVFSDQMSYKIILLLAIAQIIIHFLYFLHLDFSSEGKWNTIALLFVMVIILIIFFGSIWILSNLNHHVLLH